MSWIDKIQNDLIIQCGDGKQYRPSWLNASYKQEYNITQFNFPDLPGTLVKREQPMGREFNIEIHFQGDNHLEIAEEFRKSANDKRSWVVQHPLYDTIAAQPLSLNFDNSGLNITKITGSIMETILEDNPKTAIAPLDNIKKMSDDMDETLEDAFTEPPTPADLDTATATNLSNYSKGVPIIEIPAEFESYYNLFNTANAAISTAIASPLLFMRSIVAMIKYPSQFTTSVKSRIQQLIDQWETLKSTVEGIAGVSGKQSFQNQGAANLAAMCYSASTPLPDNYTNTIDVLFIINKITTVYDEFMTELDALQDENGGNPNYFIANGDVIFQLNELVAATVSSLFIIALNAKQQRSLILETDSNIINLTHLLYSLDPNDANIDELIANNNFGLNQMLQIKKNTTVYYYI